jgi:SAM-dependent methyltransferase
MISGPASLSLVLGLLLATPALAQEHDHSGHDHDDHRHDATANHRFEDPERWAARFEAAERDAWQLPDSVVAALIDRDDLVVADIGSATGYFPVRFARAVPAGAVIGSDVEPSMVMYLNDRARTEGLANLTSVLAAPDDPHLPRRVDLVFLCNTFHHINDRIEYFRRLREQLADRGRVAVVDFRLDSEKGPPHKLAPEIVEEELAGAGFELIERHEFLPEQYFQVYRVLE